MLRWPVGVVALAVAGCTVQAPDRVAGAPERVMRNSIGMELALIEPGTFTVGRFQPSCPSRSDPVDANEPERARWTDADYAACEAAVKLEAVPGFTVKIERAFHIGRYEVTQAEWVQVMQSNPSAFQHADDGIDPRRRPVDSVTWEDAQRFIQALNRLEQTTAYRLPTEFEWEYAARAGAASDPTWDEIRELAWEQQVEQPYTRPVGTKRANAWGLHDMLGNVWEWVDDYDNGKLFADPAPPQQGTARVLKGGGFLADVKNAIYSTHAAGPGDGFDVGFRVVRDVDSRGR